MLSDYEESDGNKRTPSILVCRLRATGKHQINHVKLGGQSYVCVAGIIVSHSFQSVETCCRAGASSLQLSKSLRHIQALQVRRLLQDHQVWLPASPRSSSIVAVLFKFHRLAIQASRLSRQVPLSRLFPSDSPFPVPLSVSLFPAQPILYRPDYLEVSWLCEPLSMS